MECYLLLNNLQTDQSQRLKVGIKKENLKQQHEVHIYLDKDS